MKREAKAPKQPESDPDLYANLPESVMNDATRFAVGETVHPLRSVPKELQTRRRKK